MDDSLGRLYQQVIEAKSGDPNLSRTAKLMRSGRAKMAKKLAEEAGVRPHDVFAEMARRERLFGLAEKLPKKHVEITSRRKVVLLDSRRKSRRR